MNKLYFNYPDGFPFETEVLQSMQESWQEIADLAKAFGNVIISGCGTDGSQSTAKTTVIHGGVIVLNGEIVKFKGGTLTSENNCVKIFEDNEYLELEGGDSVVFRKKREAYLNNEGVPFSDFVRIKKLSELTELIKNKVDKQPGKGLSTYDYTGEDKTTVTKAGKLWSIAPNIELWVSASGDIIRRSGISEMDVTIQRQEYQGQTVQGLYYIHIDGLDNQSAFEDAHMSVMQMQKGDCSCHFDTNTNSIEVQTSDGSQTGDSYFIFSMKL